MTRLSDWIPPNTARALSSPHLPPTVSWEVPTPLPPIREEALAEEEILWEGEEEQVPVFMVDQIPLQEREELATYIPPKYLPIYTSAKVHSTLSEIQLLEVYHERVRKREETERRRVQQEQARRQEQLLQQHIPHPPAVPRPKNQPGRGPPKKELHERRMLQYGEILEMIGVPSDTTIRNNNNNTRPIPVVTHRAWPAQLPLEASPNTELMFANCTPIPPTFARAASSPIWVQTSRKPTRLTSTLDDVRTGIRMDVQVIPEARELWLIEYAERDPLIQPVIGMGGVMVHVTRKRAAGTVAVSSVPPYGEMIRLEKDEPSPIMSEIAPDNIVTLFRTDVSNVPVFEHPLKTDFLLTRSSLCPKRVMVHPIQRVFCGGQVEPLTNVPAPHEVHSSAFTPFLVLWIQFHVLKRMIDSLELRIPESCPASMFPYVSSNTIDRALKEIVSRQGRYLVPKAAALAAGVEPCRAILMERLYEHMEHIRPIEIAKWYAYLSGMRRIQVDAGITNMVKVNMTTVLTVYRVVYDLFCAMTKMAERRGVGVTDTMRIKTRAALYICRELECSAWYLSYCFQWLFREAEGVHNPFPKMTVMQVSGIGDPSGRGVMVSFLPNYSRVLAASSSSSSSASCDPELFHDFSEARNRRRKKKSPYRQSSKSEISGTKNDIRTVKMEKLGEILLQLGIPHDALRDIDRWDRTWLILKVATDHPDGKYLLDGALEKYVRLTLNEGVYSESVRERLDSSMQDETLERQSLERTDHYQAFRQLATAAHRRMKDAFLHPARPCLVRSSSGEGEQPDEDMEEFANNLMQSMLDDSEVTAAPSAAPPTTKRRALSRGGGRRHGISALDTVLYERSELERFQADRAKDEQRLAARDAKRREDAEIQAFLKQVESTPRRRFIQRTIVSVLPDQSKSIRVEFHRII